METGNERHADYLYKIAEGIDKCAAVNRGVIRRMLDESLGIKKTKVN